jgi:hypothetical protein
VSGAESVGRTLPGRARPRAGQALVELALVLPLLLFLAFAVVGAGRIVQAQLGVGAVAREAARAGVSGRSAPAGQARGEEVGRGYALSNGSLAVLVDGGRFASGGQVRAVASYEVRFDDLPLLGWARVRVRGEALEAIDLYRSSK